MQETENSSTLFSNDSRQSIFAEVIIPLALPKNYTWVIPEYLQENVHPGSRVEVQLKNKKVLGNYQIVTSYQT